MPMKEVVTMCVSDVGGAGSRNTRLTSLTRKLVNCSIKIIIPTRVLELKCGELYEAGFAMWPILSGIGQKIESELSPIRYGNLAMHCQILSAKRRRLKVSYYA